MSSPITLISLAGRDIAKKIEDLLQQVADEPMGFCLFVWTDGRAQYISNCNRDDIIPPLLTFIEKWKKNEPMPPPHEIN
jgi:hypothetical protein